MISTYYSREIQRDNERNIKKANEFKHYDTRDLADDHIKPGIISRLLNGSGSVLVKIGTRLQCFSAFGQAKT